MIVWPERLMRSPAKVRAPPASWITCPSGYERKINAPNLRADPDRDTFRIDGGRRTGKIRWRKPHHFGFAPRVHSPCFARRRQNEVRAGGKSEEPVLADIVGLGSAFAGMNQTTSP